MSKYNETILTAGGLDLATRAANGKTKFTITKATATADDLTTMSETDLQNLIVLPNEVQTGSITNQTENVPTSKSVVGTEILFTNQGIDKGYLVNAVGLYAKEDGKDEEILYALNTAVEPEFMPDFADQVLLQFRITMYVIVGRTENVTVTIDPSGMASKDYVNTKIAEIDVNDKIQDEDIAKKLQNKLVYTDNKSQDKNVMTQVAEALGSAVYGFKTIDKDGNVTSILPDSDSLVTLPGEWNNNTGGSTDPDHPAAGVDIYPGSLANGEITERHCLWQGNSDPTQITNVSFSQDVGAKMDRVGEGLTFLLYIQRTAINKGLKGDAVKLPFNYDPNNLAKEGYYTTTAPVPSYIRAKSFEVDKEQVVTYNGIGENLTTIKNHQSPGVGFTFKADKTMDIRPIQGFDNDGAADGITGYTYDVVVEVIADYSIQTAVQQLPASINFFTGSASGDIALSGVSDFFENSMDGIEITMEDYMYIRSSPSGTLQERTLATNIVESPIIRIPKDKLIQGINNNMSFKLKVIASETGKLQPPISTDNNKLGASGVNWQVNGSTSYYFLGFDISKLIINKASISINVVPNLKYSVGSLWQGSTWSWNAVKVSPYKN
ncbi:phage tail protein [Companilactobacillus nantensis]|uniref:Phage tail fibre protein N-terminal domain-containing protein n=1 Tax=Companilactobacillus nantensis DSM 16982 TaxID=1423774 RepID=A0A0R1WHX3_9LACO|nr:phage tail protein [Companilactobacillus nantensis]KRM17502.1 hypothetical protein FD31_GL002695 [Companilactobacillus nantensis DSM 16982]GEO64477.1 hypothetical protein LNA01_16600 [Companilactobacillus nantensis]